MSELASEPSDTGAPADATGRGGAYSERLHVTWYWWPLPLLAALILAAEVHMGYGGLRSWLPYVVLLPLTALLIFRMGRTRIEVRDGELRVGEAHVPLRFVGAVDVVDARHKRAVLGPQLDPAAFVVHRGWVGPVLRVQLTDPADPTPYWLFSTRRPEQLAEILRTAT
ncbi:MAG TPA: DUF3093 domain-containing protein [Actinophytocola sp.]|uniref:DUF3093 domain-containing protein n=1 Tax=Actinophytocola sp. TaxID=1872138 RepID=UPI002DDD05C5|nr:DUF3093 domain-containing protein [Actinophytocola sp.]HEV2779118.1 DUF3093 domain-containing protein [Actinophytocola sp.]